MSDHRHKEGAALLVALWVLIILSLIVGSFAFEVKLESMLISYKRKKFRAEMMAHSGIEYARAILDKQQEAQELEIEDMGDDDDGFMMAALHTKRGLSTSLTVELDNGSFTITLESAEGGLNANALNREDWLDTFEMANIPSTDWDSMIDCLDDWIDEGDLYGLNGAESDDPFYQDAGYPVKNGPLDSVEELLLVKGWGEDVLYGKEADDHSDEIFGLAKLLTVWGDGRLNLNTASVDAMRAAGLSDELIMEILDARKGDDGESGTLDDGIKTLAGLVDDASKFKLQSDFVKVTSVGDIFGNQYQIECILLAGGKDSVVVYWKEGSLTKNAPTR